MSKSWHIDALKNSGHFLTVTEIRKAYAIVQFTFSQISLVRFSVVRHNVNLKFGWSR